MSSLTCLASPRMAAMWRGVSPRSFLLLTLSFCRDEALLGTFFCTGVVCEGWLGVESGNKQREKYLIDAWSKSLTGKPVLTCLCVYFQHLRTNLHCLTTNHHNLFTKIISVMFSGYIFNDNSTISLGKYTEQPLAKQPWNIGEHVCQNAWKHDSANSKYTLSHLEDVVKVRGQAHKPGLLAVICIRRAICLRSDRGYPNKRLAWDFLPPASFFTFFLSGPSLSATKPRKMLESGKKTGQFHFKQQSHRQCDAVFLLPLYLLSTRGNRWQAWGLIKGDKKKTAFS